MKRIKRSLALGAVWLVVLFPAWCGAQSSGFILLASTIGPIDSGIVGLLENEFEKESGIRVRHVGAGTGAALEIAGGISISNGKNKYAYYNGYYYEWDYDRIHQGQMMIGLGTPLFLGGVALAIIGGVNAGKYQKLLKGFTVDVQSSTKFTGVSVQYKF